MNVRVPAEFYFSLDGTNLSEDLNALRKGRKYPAINKKSFSCFSTFYLGSSFKASFQLFLSIYNIQYL